MACEVEGAMGKAGAQLQFLSTQTFDASADPRLPHFNFRNRPADMRVERRNGPSHHAALSGRGIPTDIGVLNATIAIHDGSRGTVDGIAAITRQTST
jgi:hypothetical protein